MRDSDNHIAISLVGVSKIYTIHHEKPTLVENLLKKNETFWALRDINFQINRGERVGIIGPNGSGKTTLLKVIADITTPTEGKVKTFGRIVSLIDLEAGFQPDLTGEQNIYLNGIILGMKKREIDKNFDAIIKFADIRHFIDAPLFTYSDGMKLRLGFAIAAHANPDIIILDEGLAAGDKDFQKKIRQQLNEFYRKRKTILVVSHWLDFIEKTSNRVIILQHGKIIKDGGVGLIEKYRQSKIV